MTKALKINGVLLLIFSLLVFSGGLMGFVLKKSTPSLVMGGFFGLALLWASVLHFISRKWGIYLAFILMFLLEGFFSYRYIMTQAFFPAGIMMILTSIFLILMILVLIRGSK